MQRDERLRSRREASEFLGVPERTLATWAYEGRGPRYVRVGKLARYSLDDLLAWLEGNAREPRVSS
jgi:excisionase family DNA binding protein